MYKILQITKILQTIVQIDRQWECDLSMISGLIDNRTKAILVCNPSNPCGSNFSTGHLQAIAAIAHEHKIILVVDEIYARCVYNGDFNPIHLHSAGVPVVSLGGLSKQYAVPGWKIGWVILHDKGSGQLNELRKGIKRLALLQQHGACSLMQVALPILLDPTYAPFLQQYRDKFLETLRCNVHICINALDGSNFCRGLTAIEPVAALYILVKIDFSCFESSMLDDEQFVVSLLKEENIFILPGKHFSLPGYLRLLISSSTDSIQEALSRLNSFCTRHSCSN